MELLRCEVTLPPVSHGINTGRGKTVLARTGTSQNHVFAWYFVLKNTRFRIYQKPAKYRIQQTGQAIPSRPGGPPAGAPFF